MAESNQQANKTAQGDRERLMFARSLVRDGREQEALDELLKYLRKNGNSVAAILAVARIYARQGKQSSLIADGRKVTFLSELRCAFPSGTDVTKLDRVARIDDRLGAEIFAGPLTILSLEKRRGHLEAMLERVA